MKHLTLILFALAVAALALACEPLDDDFLDPADACNLSEGTSVVSGTWNISGTGRRTDCTDPRFDAEELSINSKGLSIVQDDDGNLSLSADIPGFALSNASVRGTCVDFSTTEESADPANNLLFTWDGDVRADGAITGTFTGEGPQGCNTSGTFSITID